jgi:predicted membrane protein
MFLKNRVARSFVLCIIFCRSLFVLLAIALSVLFDLRLLMIPLVSSSISQKKKKKIKNTKSEYKCIAVVKRKDCEKDRATRFFKNILLNNNSEL